ncbi:MAG TPA: HNH endonuclease [Candidatus Mediterraneibacter norwichensis]|nr:HNH endonuclease [Candidatus Mediterraneibacter norwichensis]
MDFGEISGIKEIKEMNSDRFAECPIGKSVEGKEFDLSEIEYDKSLVKNVEKNCPLEHGRWDGERGDSKWYPDPDYIPQKSNPENKTWGEILKKYRIDGIPFKDGEPDFSEVSKGTVEIDGFSERREDNFDKADIELAKQRGCSPEDVKKWRKENGYTWHECKDKKTMQKVPAEIHNNISHSGGISEIKKERRENE